MDLLQEILRAAYELQECREAYTNSAKAYTTGLGGPILGEMDWLAELHRLMELIPMNIERISRITHRLDDVLDDLTYFDGPLSEQETLEILRIFNASIRRRTTYGADTRTVSPEIQGNNSGDVRTDEQEKS